MGGNGKASLRSGIRFGRVEIFVYTVAGILAAARPDAAQPHAGTGYEPDAMGAVVIGGASLSGGRGSIVGTAARCMDGRSLEQRTGAPRRVALPAAGDKRDPPSCRLS